MKDKAARGTIEHSLNCQRELLKALVQGGVITMRAPWIEDDLLWATPVDTGRLSRLETKVDLLLDHLGLKVEHVNEHDKLVKNEEQ